jgi:hypothetical protein
MTYPPIFFLIFPTNSWWVNPFLLTAYVVTPATIFAKLNQSVTIQFECWISLLPRLREVFPSLWSFPSWVPIGLPHFTFSKAPAYFFCEILLAIFIVFLNNVSHGLTLEHCDAVLTTAISLLSKPQVAWACVPSTGPCKLHGLERMRDRWMPSAIQRNLRIF